MKMNHRNWKRLCAGFLTLLLVISMIPQLNGVHAEETAASKVDAVFSKVSSYVLKEDVNPDFESTWNMVGLVRGGSAPQSYKDTYYNNTMQYVREKNWVLHSVKYTEYSKLIVALTTLGKDVRNIEGHNLLANLSDFNKVKKQGFNGPIWALIALKSNPEYQIPLDSEAATQTTEEVLIQSLLSGQLSSGGWNLTCKESALADSDITGMAIQALAGYYGKREDVTQAVDKALRWITENQFASGGFGTPSVADGQLQETCESTVQIIVALSSLGIDCAKDGRFIKNGKSPLDGLMQYYVTDKGFMHVLEGGTSDSMATEQGLYALAAYKRLVTGKTALYDMSEFVFSVPEPKPEEPTVKPDDSTQKPDNTKPDNSTQKPDSTKPDGSTQKPDNTKPDNSTQKPDNTKPAVNTKLKLRVAKTTTTAITLQWNKISNAKGYVVEIYNAAKKKYEKAAQLTAGKNQYSLKRTKGTKGSKLASGTVYKLRVRTIVSINGKAAYKQTEAIVTATAPDRVSFTKLSRKSSTKAKLTWKKIKRSTGYEIYMSGKKNSGYKKAKTITKNKTVSYTQAKLKKGRTYYFKVRAYKKAGNKKIYGSFSKVKSIKMK